MIGSGVPPVPATAGVADGHVETAPARKLSLWLRMLPILFFLSYLNLTVFLFAYGPWPWPVKDGTKLYVFLAFAHLALLLGYVTAAVGRPGGYHGRLKVQQIVVASLIVNIALLIPTSVSRTGRFLPDVRGGLANLGAAYAASLALRLQRTGFVEYVRIVMGPLLSILLPLVTYYWQTLKWRVRGVAVCAIMGYLAIYVSTGTNKAIADLVILVPWLLLASYLSGVLKLSRRQKTLIVVSAVVASALFLVFFTAGQLVRPGSGAVAGYFPFTGTYADPDNWLVRNLPTRAQKGAISLGSYLTQGYYALYLSLEKPFVPMFGVGNSMFLYRNAARLTGIQAIETMPYPVRIQADGWNAYVAWSSIYPWIASDVSFAGTVLVVFLIGRLFALSWLDTLRGRNPFAIAAFAQFTIMLFYFPANNQVLQEGDSLLAFYTILILWLLTRRRYVWGTRAQEPVPTRALPLGR
jgi:hypothetical protein